MSRGRPLWSAAATPGPQPPVGAYMPPPATPAPGILVRWVLYAFAFSLAFDAPGQLPLEPSTVMGALFILATMLQPRACYGRRPAALWWFAGYLYVYWLAFVLTPSSNLPGAVRASLFYVHGLLILWAASNLMRHREVARRVLLTLVFAAAILAIMTILGLGRIRETHSGRAVVFGQDPNFAARSLSIGLLSVIGLAYGRPHSALRPRFIAWPIAAVIAVAMILGASRGGLLALAFGLWTFSFLGDTLGARVKNTTIALFAIGLCSWGALQSPLMKRRLAEAEAGDMAQRQEIFPASWQMFKERPLTGWGQSNQFVLARRLRLPPERWPTRDTHNLFLEILTGTGVMGTIPFLMGLWLCGWSAWKARRGPEGILPTAHCAALLMANLSVNFIMLKVHWLLLAYALASAAFVPPPQFAPLPNRASTSRHRRRRWG
jgi:O-antigen ligase